MEVSSIRRDLERISKSLQTDALWVNACLTPIPNQKWPLDTPEKLAESVAARADKVLDLLVNGGEAGKKMAIRILSIL